MQAGVQFKDAWIPACEGMADGYHVLELYCTSENIFEIQQVGHSCRSYSTILI